MTKTIRNQKKEMGMTESAKHSVLKTVFKLISYDRDSQVIENIIPIYFGIAA